MLREIRALQFVEMTSPFFNKSLFRGFEASEISFELSPPRGPAVMSRDVHVMLYPGAARRVEKKSAHAAASGACSSSSGDDGGDGPSGDVTSSGELTFGDGILLIMSESLLLVLKDTTKFWCTSRSFHIPQVCSVSF